MIPGSLRHSSTELGKFWNSKKIISIILSFLIFINFFKHHKRNTTCTLWLIKIPTQTHKWCCFIMMIFMLLLFFKFIVFQNSIVIISIRFRTLTAKYFSLLSCCITGIILLLLIRFSTLNLNIIGITINICESLFAISSTTSYFVFNTSIFFFTTFCISFFFNIPFIIHFESSIITTFTSSQFHKGWPLSCWYI